MLGDGGLVLHDPQGGCVMAFGGEGLTPAQVQQIVRRMMPSRRWAKVTGTGPLRVTFPQEAAQVPVAVTCVGGLVVGDTVRVEIDGTEMIIIGRKA